MKVIQAYLNRERTRICQEPPLTVSGWEPFQVPVTDNGHLIIMVNGQIPVVKGPLDKDLFQAIKVDNNYMLRFKYHFIRNQAHLDSCIRKVGLI